MPSRPFAGPSAVRHAVRWMRARLGRSAAAERELDEEVRGFAEELAARHVRDGMDPLDARRRTLAEMGGIEPVKEQARDVRAGMALELWLKDVGLAWRGLRRTPALTLVVVLTLAAGVATSTLLFTQLNAVLFKPLPVAAPEALRHLSWTATDLSFAGGLRDQYAGQIAQGRAVTAFSHLAYDTLRAAAAGVADIACSEGNLANLQAIGRSGRIGMLLVTGNYFHTVGIPVQHGRGIVEADDQPDREPVAVISDRLWRRDYGADPDILRRSIPVRGRPVPIVGVMASGFSGLEPTSPRDVLLPYAARRLIMPTPFDPTVWRGCALVARLHDPAAEAQAQATLDVLLTRAIVSTAPQWRGTARLHLIDASRGHDTLRDVTRRPLLLLLGGVGLLLLMACANVGGLLMTRAAAQEHETATRLALGASRGRVARLRLNEAMLLALAGGTAGVLLSLTIAPRMPDLLGRLGEVPGGVAPSRLEAVAVSLAPDVRVLAFALAVMTSCGVAISLAPALRSARVDLLIATTTRRAIHGTARRWRGGAWLLGAQIAVAMTLAVTASLFSRSLDQLMATPTGFEPTHAVFVTVNDILAAGGRVRAVEQIAGIPGVTAAAASQWPLFSDADRSTRVCVGGGADRQEIRVDSDRITPRFFDSWGVPIIAGRDFTPSDTRAAIVNETFARQHFPRGAVGQTVGLSHAPLSPIDTTCPGTPLSIVGVVADHRDRPRAPITPMVYVPFTLLGPTEPVTLSLRTAGEAAGVVGAVRQLVGTWPTAVGGDVTTGVEYRDRTVTQLQLLRALFLSFGAAAVLLAALGIYGLLAHAVRQRRPEIGLRLALGALRSDVARTVLRPAGIPVGMGMAAGALAVWLLRRWLEPWLFQVSGGDMRAYGAAAGVFLLVALLATVVPIVRATRVQLLQTLRTE